ncbi:hypothetical protein [Sinisalibacter aestuarii]|uniref:GAF domain-containing protein n=1 Tax=Sinisalibacter aestuarii TaxID=2949426 RepID=A0ABQ5LSK1_9RHOB|nr:hypothetical protein [Sinisalibacter aestuarii]GKY87718.1 hypothetical protein STA1M1_15870 [Sinisalibacter aestuarii]
MTAYPYDMARVADILAAPQSARMLFGYLLDGLRRDVGSKLTTASIYDLDAMRSRRVFSDDPDAYPTGNFKRLDRNRYYATVIEGAKPFSSTSIGEIAEVFFDWEKIQALGLESNMNLPALANGRVIGTVNLLHTKGHYTADKVAAALAWQPIATLCFLLLMQGDPEKDSFIDPDLTSTGPVMEGA